LIFNEDHVHTLQTWIVSSVVGIVRGVSAKKVMGLIFAAGGFLALFFGVNIPVEIWYLYVGVPLALLTGLLGAVVGSMIDDRRMHWRGLLGVVGFLIGGSAGYLIVSNMVNDPFAGGAFQGILFGIPGGIILGCFGGIMLGRRLDAGSLAGRASGDKTPDS
jgi:hypothetical protein